MTRDSILFSWLAVLVAIASYFATGGDPRTWDVQHWLQAIIAIAGIISAKLGTSPLPAKAEIANGGRP